MEGFFTALIDEFPQYLRRHREIFIAFVCLASYVIGLSMVTEVAFFVWIIMSLLFKMLFFKARKTVIVEHNAGHILI